jgi:hypothetical protein
LVMMNATVARTKSADAHKKRKRKPKTTKNQQKTKEVVK